MITADQSTICHAEHLDGCRNECRDGMKCKRSKPDLGSG